MEEKQPVDLTYVTERIITVLCPPGPSPDTHSCVLQQILLMLETKHGQNYLLLNVSRRNDTLDRMNLRVLDTGWTDLLAPSLDRITNVCAAMENWLQIHQKHVLVLLCQGDEGLVGVLVASYMFFSSMSDSAGLSLDHFAMRRFYNDKLSAKMSASQKRYAWMFGSLLKGGLRMCPSPSFLLCIVLHGLPRIRPDGECCLFLRVYQNLQPVCTSAVYCANVVQSDRLYMVLQPAQLLQGDVMVVCYHKNNLLLRRQVVFRLQFHTGFIRQHTLTFTKADLDCASKDPRFPEGGRVELIFSDSPEMSAGKEQWHNGPSVAVDYDTSHPLVRRDSYQDASSTGAASSPPVPDGGSGALYTQVRKKSEEERPWSPLAAASSDSGLSVGSRDETRARLREGAAQDRCAQVGRPVPGVRFEPVRPLLEVMTELAAAGRGEGATSGCEPVPRRNGDASSAERETDILEDEDEDAPISGVWTENHINGENGSPRVRKEMTAVALDTPDGHRPFGRDNHSGGEENLESLTTDMDESMEQLNQLILELDPTFVPISTRCAPLKRSASAHPNGLSNTGSAHQSGWRQRRQLTDVTDYAGLPSPGWRAGSNQCFGISPIHNPTLSPAQKHQQLCKTNSEDRHNAVPPTPAFPVSPPTPYVKNFSELSQLGAGGLWDSGTQESRSFLDSVSHAGGASTDGELFRSEVTPTSCQRIFGSARSVSSGSPLPHTDSSTPPPGWHDRTPDSHNSPRASPPSSLSTPNAHSSPRGPPKGLGARPGICIETGTTESSLLANGSLLETMDGLGGLSLGSLPPLLPEKRRGCESGDLGSRSPSHSGFSSPHSGSSLSIPFSSSMTPEPLRGLGGTPSPAAEFGSKQYTVKFVQDTSKFWYKPDISREQAISVLKDKEPGSFIVRDSHSFRGAYGLAMKVATPPPSVMQQSKKAGDLSNELVRHFLIECTQKGVRLKGCPNEPYFGSLTALVCQHSITPLALPCKLILPDRDPVEELSDSSAQTATNSAAELLKQGAACNVWYLGSVELESLTGHQAVQKATTQTLAADPPPASTVVHFKVSAQGITLTDNQRKLFFRRHYAVNTVIFCSLDPQGRKWARGSASTAKIFGFVARKSQTETENVCHLFAEHDPEQPASAIVNFVSKVMIGSHKK